MNNKIIITIPEELKNDLRNTKAFDGKQGNQESFFVGVDFLDQNQAQLYFEGYKILYLKYLSTKLGLGKTCNLSDFINIKNKISLFKNGPYSIEDTLDLSLKINSYKNEKGFDKLDYFYYFVFRFNEIKFPKIFFYIYLRKFEFRNIEDLLQFFGLNNQLDYFLFHKYLLKELNSEDFKNKLLKLLSEDYKIEKTELIVNLIMQDIETDKLKLLKDKFKQIFEKKIGQIKASFQMIKHVLIYNNSLKKGEFTVILENINNEKINKLVLEKKIYFLGKHINEIKKIISEIPTDKKIIKLYILYIISNSKANLLKNFKRDLFEILFIFKNDYFLDEEDNKCIYLFFCILNNLLKSDKDFFENYTDLIRILHKFRRFTNYNQNLIQFYNSLYKKNKNFVLDIFSKDEIKKVLIITPWKDTLPIEILQYIDTKYLVRLLNKKSFSSQEKEVQDFIENYNSGSCLVSGYRGIGKTSLINSCIEEYKNNEKDKNIIPIHINIPEANESGKLDKKEIINRIIVKIFDEVNKNKDIPSKLKKDFFEHYIRVYNEVENKQIFTKEYEKEFKFEIKDILNLTIFIIISVFIIFWIGGNFVSSLESIFSENFKIILGITSISGLISSTLLLSYKENNRYEKIIKELYSPDIIENKITNSISKFNKGGLKVKDLFEILYNFFKYKLLLGLYFIFLLILVYYINVDLSYLIIFELILLIGFIGYFLKKNWNKQFYKPIKFIFVIDELDKLLDFEKQIEHKKNTKITMTKVFEVLGKLKTLFFDTNGAIFFVVTNKQAYDYYLQNRHQEDDLISNIFNKIIYLPMNDKENFNINFQIEIFEESQNKKDNNFIVRRSIMKKLKNYLYFKSHGNWRKARFELSHISKGNEIILEREKFELENIFYDFFDTLYRVFEKGNLEKNRNDKFGIIIEGYKDLNDFLFGFNEGNFNKLYNTKEDKEKGFYLQYLQGIKDLIDEIKEKDKQGQEIFAIHFLDIFIKKIENSENFKKEYFGYITGSINKLIEEYAYRDFVLNYLLNIFENIKFSRKTNFKEIFENIQINSEDLKSLAFSDLILYWLPLFLFYFSNLEYNE